MNVKKIKKVGFTIPSFSDLWDDTGKKMKKLGAKKNEIQAGELCAFSMYNKMVKLIRGQLNNV